MARKGRATTNSSPSWPSAWSIGVSNLVGPRRPNPTKLGAYELGNEPLADVPGTRFSIICSKAAMLFLIFDVEAVFVCPWAVVLRELDWARVRSRLSRSLPPQVA